MPYLLLVAAVLVLFVAVLYSSLLLLGVGFFAGAAWAVGIACVALAGKWRPVTASPDRVVAGTAGLPRRRGDHPYTRDWAWPGYPVSQWRYDGLLAWSAGRRRISDGYRRMGEWQKDPWWVVILQVVPFAGWTGVAVGMLAGALYVVAVGAAVLAVMWLCWGSVIGLLRSGDRAVRRFRKADVVCPHPRCYRKQHVPAYECAHCRRVHHDIRPGLLGAVRRRCGCGGRMPTTVTRAAKKLTGLCERCELPLRAGSAAVTGIALPVFGPVSAGKTRLMLAGLVQLREEIRAAGGTVEFEDEHSERTFEEASHLVATGDNTAKTPAGQQPAATTFRIRHGRHHALVNLFDAAGEFFSDPDQNRELEFLDHAGGLVFVLDPFSVPWVRDQLGAQRDARLAAAQPAAEAPDDVYQVTARRLKDRDVELHRRALAIVIVKADLLGGLGCADPLLQGRAREWLETAGLDNLVLSAERDFAAVEVFVTSSVTGSQAAAVGDEVLVPSAPLRWLMNRGGFPTGALRERRPAEEAL